MQQVEAFDSGERNYMKIKGGTGAGPNYRHCHSPRLRKHGDDSKHDVERLASCPCESVSFTCRHLRPVCQAERLRVRSRPNRPAGPLVYPAGFLYVYSWLKKATGGDVAAAQPLFAVIYTVNLSVVLNVIVNARIMPPIALGLLTLSKRRASARPAPPLRDPTVARPAAPPTCGPSVPHSQILF